MILSNLIRETSGYAWVLSRLEPVSPLGYARSRQPVWYGPGMEGELEAELERISAVSAWDGGLRDAISHSLSRFRDLRGSFRREKEAPMDTVELFEVKHFLLCLEQLKDVYEKAPLEGISLPDLEDMLNLLDPEGRRLPVFSVEAAFEPSLERIRREKRAAEEALRGASEDGREALMARRRVLTAEEDRAELAARRRLTRALMAEKERFLAAMDAVGRLDLVLAKEKLARKMGCVRPCIAKEPVVRVTDMVFPRAAERLAEEGRTYTPVSLCLEAGSTVITGANMGGKSLSLKAVTLNLLLLHTGCFVFAGGMSAPLFDAVHLICTDEQSAQRGLSSFGAEVAALDKVLREGKGRFFFLALDEFARGTNPREGAALARALTQRLNGDDLGCVALLTTHYDGVSDAARRHYQVAGLRDVGGRGLEELSARMDYRLIPAPPGTPCPRDALKVCRMLELEEKLTQLFAENI